MIKFTILSVLLCFILTSLTFGNIWGSSYDEKWTEEGDSSQQHFPNNEFLRIITDFWNKLGLKYVMNDIGQRLKIAVRMGKLFFIHYCYYGCRSKKPINCKIVDSGFFPTDTIYSYFDHCR